MMIMSLFILGQTVITRNALHVCQHKEIDPIKLLARHGNGDWGDLCQSDKQLNKQAIGHDDRILSKYIVNGESFYIITEWDRSYTTIMLCSDY